jgi:hypothetical protein
MPSNEPTSIVGGLIRLFWMIVGPVALVLLAVNLATHKRGWGDLMNVAFLVILIALIVARRSDPNSADGTPTTPAQLRNYSIAALVLGIATWFVVNLVGKDWLAP